MARTKVLVLLIVAMSVIVWSALSGSVNAGELCQHYCAMTGMCDSRTEPCNNHQDGMSCWRCSDHKAMALCVPVHGQRCTTTGASGGLCGDMYKSTCSDGKCGDGVYVGSCERQMCTTGGG